MDGGAGEEVGAGPGHSSFLFLAHPANLEFEGNSMFKGAAEELPYYVLVPQVGFYFPLSLTTQIYTAHTPPPTKKNISYLSAFGGFRRFGGWCGNGHRCVFSDGVVLEAGRQKHKVRTKLTGSKKGKEEGALKIDQSD